MIRPNKAFFLVTLLCSTAALAQTAPQSAPDAQTPAISYPTAKIEGALKFQALNQTNTDLGTDGETDADSQSLDLRLRATGELNEKLSYLLEGRGVKNYGSGGGEDPVSGESLGAEDFLELRQSWVEFSPAGNTEPLGIRIGRQRFYDPYGLWWNRDLDAASVRYDNKIIEGFIGIGENLASYRTSEEQAADEENLLRFLAEASWQWRFNQFVELRASHLDDHSGGKEIGALMRADDRDDDDARLTWLGLRMRGDLPGALLLPGEDKSNSTYRIDLAGVTGHEDTLSSSAAANGFRSVTGETGRDVRGWAIDASLNYELGRVMFDPVLMFGAAYGSGDDNPSDGTDNGFRQTGLDSNLSRPISGALGTNHNYGSVLRPDLTNLTILSAGIALPLPRSTGDLSATYRRYSLNHEDGGLGSNSIDASLSGTDKDLGQGIDFMANLSLSNTLNITHPRFDDIGLKATYGAFKAGDAYGTAEGEVSTRALVELTYRF